MLNQYGNGRFGHRAMLPVNSAAPGGVENIAALEALDDSVIDDGTIVVVLTLEDGFQLDKDSTLVSDHITVADTLSGTGRWIRERWPSLRWRLQSTWYIDAAGDDENSGLTALLPLETHEELMRRWGGVPLTISPTVNIASDLTGDIVMRAATEDGQTIAYVGERTTLYSGTLTAFTAYNQAITTLGTVTAAALPVSWTASGLVDGCLRMTAGASSGARGWITYDAGAKVARFSPLLLAGNNADPTLSTFVVESLTQIAGRYDQIGDADVTFTDLRISDPLMTTAAVSIQAGYCTFTTCDLEPADGVEVVARARGAAFYGCRINADALLVNVGEVSVGACYLDECAPTAADTGLLVITLDSLGQGPGSVPLTARDMARIRIDELQWYAVADQTDASGGGAICETAARIYCEGQLWGASNAAATTGIKVEPGGLVLYDPLAAPAVGTPTVEVSIDSVSYDYDELPVFDAVAAAGVIKRQDSPLAIEGAILWLRSDLGVTITGSGVSEWLDQSGHDNHAAQTVDADRPAYLPAGGVNGLPGVEFDSANTEWMSLGTITEASNDWTVIAVVSQGALAGTQYLLATADDALVAAGMRMGASNWVGGDDGTADRDGMPPLLGEQYLEWHWDSGAGTLSCYRDGVLLGSDSFDGTLALSLSATLGALASGAGPFNGVVSELIVFDRMLSSAELAAVRSYIESRYALSFSPASVADLLYWLRTDDAASITTVAASELLVNGDFTAWSGAGFAQSPDGWVTANPGTAANHVIQDPAGHMTMTSDGTAVAVSQIACVTGKTYQIVIDVVSVTGSFTVTGTANYTVIAAPGVYTLNVTADHATIQIKRGGAGTYVINSISVKLSTDANVSQWSDTYGSRSVVQATESKRPLYLPTGGPNGGPCISFDGVNEILQGAWADETQPFTRIAVIRPTRTARVPFTAMDGKTNQSAVLYDPTTANRMLLYAGATTNARITPVTTSDWLYVQMVLNGANSSLSANGSVPVVGNAGVTAVAGMTLGAFGNSITPTDTDVTDLVGITGVPPDATLAALYQYLKGLRGL